MKWLQHNWTLLVIIALGLLLFRQCNANPKVIEVPVNIPVNVPVIEKQFDTVYKVKPVIKTVKVLDSSYVKKWEGLKNDSIKRDNLFKKAIEINTYKEKVEDDSITINLHMKVRGDLLNYKVDYKTKPRLINIDTVFKVEIPRPLMIYFGAEATLPTNVNITPSLGPSILIIPKNHKYAVKGSYDFINKVTTVGVYYKF